ncbi:period circadian protein homolog 2-like [Pecten maximus]|uniref:period circadian protein homolog 2-like n=1 Tax=Pecten maximus TaxID=6579 RepID=UPI0014587D8B|nr:period circadian protein homolog 2-like [Pecten maximus]XP_033763800.1 period circadian protein homolog 2-like [Pecten maximus]
MAGEPDSNYGSYCLSTVQSSTSSLSMSLIESDLVEDQPSTSGCSSEQPYTTKLALKKSRKEQVKRYLKELKGLVVQPQGNIGTLSALQQVVDTFKQIKEEKESSSKLAKKEEEFNLPFDEQDDLNSLCLNQQEALFFTLRYPDLNIAAVSKNITDVLGYPEPNYLVGRDLCNFVHKKDIVTMNSSMSVHQMNDEDSLVNAQSEDRDKFQIQKKLFYFRLRKYKALPCGFRLASKETEFLTFQATVAQQSPGVDLKRMKKSKLSIVLRCVPVVPAYEVDEQLQNMTFSTRHSLFCSYSHIDSKSIPLLGFLPQDIVGMSIFDFYHPDDIELLYGIYQQVVNTETVPFESPPFRLRVRNGDWVYVRTEWSRFVNPWSHRLEFVIGQHKVIKGPSRRDIFSPMLNEEMNVSLSDNLARLKQMIRDLLLKPLVQVQIATPNLSIGKHRFREDVPWTESEDPMQDQHSIAYANDSNASNSVSTNKETLTYDHLNYTSNIKRFLFSQKNTMFSPFSDKKSSTDEDIPEVSSCDSLLEVDISIPMPPSFGSSTKVLVSEQEREESGLAAFNQMECDTTVQPKNITTLQQSSTPTIQQSSTPTIQQSSTPTVQQSSTPSSPGHAASKEAETRAFQQDKSHVSRMSLTQEALWNHTCREETLFIEQAKEENGLMSFKLNGKRLHSLDPSSDNRRDVTKTVKVRKKQTAEKQSQKSEGKTDPEEPVSVPFRNPMFMPINSAMGLYQSTGMQYVPMDLPNDSFKANIATPTTTVAPPSTSNSMHWPYYPQSGISFIPQVMEGFFQPGTGAFQPINKQNLQVPMSKNVPCSVPNVSPIGLSPPYIRVPIPKKSDIIQQTKVFTSTPTAAVRSSFSSSHSSSLEETSSSLLYMLEYGSPNRSIISMEDVPKPRRKEAPPWLNGINWSPLVRKRYTLPKKKASIILKEDREALSKVTQPDLLLSQMAMFEEDLNQANPVFDMFQDDSFLMFPDTDFNEPTLSTFDDQNYNSSNKSETLTKENLRTHLNESNQKLKEDIQTKQQKSEESFSRSEDDAQRSSDRESLVDDDSCSSKCSGITPSDERSVEEADSSLKESDESDVGCTAKVFGSKMLSECPLKSMDFRFKKFFAPIPIHFADSKVDGPPWMTNAVVNFYTNMQYCFTPKPVENSLAADRQKLQDMPQTDLVIEQLNTFIDDNNLSQFQGPAGSTFLKSLSEKQQNAYLKVPDSLPFPQSGPSSESEHGQCSQMRHSTGAHQTSDLIAEKLVRYMFPVEPGTVPVPYITLPMSVPHSSVHTMSSNSDTILD